MKKYMDSNYYQAIGLVTANFSNLELMVAALIWTMVNKSDDKIGQMITSGMSFTRMLDLLSALNEYLNKDTEDGKKLTSFIGMANDIEARRNQVVHSAWGFKEGESQVRRIKITTKRNKGLYVYDNIHSVEELNKLGDEIAALFNELGKLDILPIKADTNS